MVPGNHKIRCEKSDSMEKAALTALRTLDLLRWINRRRHACGDRSHASFPIWWKFETLQTASITHFFRSALFVGKPQTCRLHNLTGDSFRLTQSPAQIEGQYPGMQPYGNATLLECNQFGMQPDGNATFCSASNSVSDTFLSEICLDQNAVDCRRRTWSNAEGLWASADAGGFWPSGWRVNADADVRGRARAG